MRELLQQQRLTCRWERDHVAIQLHDGQSSERLCLSLEEAERFADQLLDFHLDLHAPDRGGEQSPEVLRLGQVTMTYDTANDLMNSLGNLVFVHQRHRLPRLEHVDWKQEGF